MLGYADLIGRSRKDGGVKGTGESERDEISGPKSAIVREIFCEFNGFRFLRASRR